MFNNNELKNSQTNQQLVINNNGNNQELKLNETEKDEHEPCSLSNFSSGQ